MALDERLEAAPKHVEVQRSLEVERPRRVIRDAIVEHLAEQPQEFLRVRQNGWARPARGEIVLRRAASVRAP